MTRASVLETLKSTRGSAAVAACLSLLLTLFSCPLQANAATPPEYGHYRIGFETLSLPGDEDMGLIGGNYLLHLDDHLYGGIAAYGAVTGRRGGFFTGGVEVGARHELMRGWWLDAGIFAGGGGGGSAPQGGGLMLRPHLDLLHELPWGRLGGGISQVSFPNGAIDSVQFALTIEKDFRSLMFAPDSSISDLRQLAPAGGALGMEEHDFSLQLKSYQPVSGSIATHGGRMDQGFRVVGVEFRKFVRDDRYLSLAAYGAMGGEVDGFAQVMGRTGYRLRLSPAQSASAGVSLGAAGGGAVDTGGGLVAGVEGGWQFLRASGLSLGLEIGYLTAPDGKFSARTAGVSASYRYGALVAGRGEPVAYESLTRRNWRWRLGHQSYFPVGDTRRKNGREDGGRVDLIGVGMDVFQGDSLYFTGQALGAYDGGAGGYAAGLLGLGWRQGLTMDDRLALEFEFAAGAGGGGGLAVGGGLLVQPGIALDYRYTPRFSVQLGLARLETPNGTLTANIANLALGYRFSSFFLPVSP